VEACARTQKPETQLQLAKQKILKVNFNQTKRQTLWPSDRQRSAERAVATKRRVLTLLS
jgi:hypothetical protein